MEFTEKDYIIGAWFACQPGYGDWLMTIKRDPDAKDQTTWVGEYRFRYYADDKVWGSKDRKSFTSFRIVNETEEIVIEKAKIVMMGIHIMYPEENTFVDVKGDFKKFQFKMAQESFASIKKFNNDDEYNEFIKKEGNDGSDETPVRDNRS